MNSIKHICKNIVTDRHRITTKTILNYIVILILWISLTALYYYNGQTIGINSDGVANILEAHQIINGNIILHRWFLPLDTFYTLDTQIDVLLLWFGIYGITVYHLTPAIIYSSLLILLYHVIKYASKSSYAALVSTAIFVAFPISFYKSLVLFSPIHMLTILFVIATFYLYQGINIKYNYIYGSILLYISVTGDPYAIFIGTLPILFFALANIFKYIRNKKTEYPILTYIYIFIIFVSHVFC